MTIGGASSAPPGRRSSRLSSTPRTGSSSSSNRVTSSTTAGSSPFGSTIAAARRTRSETVIRLRSVGMPGVLPRHARSSRRLGKGLARDVDAAAGAERLLVQQRDGDQRDEPERRGGEEDLRDPPSVGVLDELNRLGRQMLQRGNAV